MIEVILGSMYAEKSTELIRRVRRHQIAGKKCIVFKHILDCNRNNTNAVMTHDKNKIEAIPVKTMEDIYYIIYNKDIDVIAIDEAQFFSKDIIDFSIEMSINFDRNVILAGLDMDYNGKPFGYMGDLACIADKVSKLHAVCMGCGADAKYSYRKTGDKEIIMIGAKEKYEALCEKCYKKRRK